MCGEPVSLFNQTDLAFAWCPDSASLQALTKLDDSSLIAAAA